MGLMYLALAAAAKKREEENSRNSKSNKSSNRSYESKSHYVSSNPSFNDCIMEEISRGDSVISPFFKMLYDRTQLNKENEIDRLTKKEEELEEKLKTMLPHFRQFQELAKEKGFNIQEFLNPGIEVSFAVNDIHFFTLDGVKYYSSAPILMELPEYLQQKIELWKGYKKEEQEEVKQLTKKIKKLEKACKVSIFNFFKKEEREKNKEKLLSLQSVLSERVHRLEDGYYDSNIDAIEKLINLDSSEKALFNEGVNDLLNCRKVVNEINYLKHTIGRLNSFSYDNSGFYKQAYEELYDKGLITGSTLENVLLSLFTVEIKRKVGGYGYYYGTDRSYSDIVTWFVDCVIDNGEKLEKNRSKGKAEENNEEKQKVKTKK